MKAFSLWAAMALCATPADELAASLADLREQPASLQATTRYVSLHNVPVEDREQVVATLSFVLNSVSRATSIKPLAVLPGTTLVRWNLADFAPQADDLQAFSRAYEQLASDDSYWHLRTEVIDPHTKRKRTVFTDGGWLDLDQAAELRALSGSGGALVRADWLIAKLAAPPHYYAFAGVAEGEKDFFASLGLDAAKIGELGAEEGANLLQSRVTHKVRRLLRRQGPLGGAWHTYDVERSTAERDPLRNPFDFTYDAGEHIATKANGLHVFALYDAQGKRQGAVPDKIAKDDSDPAGDGIVVPMISCVRCHVEDGLRPFTNDQPKIPLLGAVDPAVADRLAQFYGGAKLPTQLERDREDYRVAVRRATGREAREVAELLAAIYRDYRYELVTPAVAARELGVEVDLRTVLAGSHDPIILLLCEGTSVQREQWEASFAEAAILTRTP